ncbi:type I polyketide synthase, partial [Longimycelium tulufanense]|uniref:type I polyketide synthase n=1 Tax=Longimycelium tulufanense TaxID=907463 RepID=UPI001666F055
DFHGTGYTVDGACASSLLAVITAAQALCTGELDIALAGGVDLSLDPLELVGFARLGALASTEMRVYDAHPTGFLPGEGCGMVVLTRATDAHRLGLRIYAYLTGWGTSTDGSGGLTRPETNGQTLALHRAYHMARLSPHTVNLIEGHGTGTTVGDQVELTALTHIRGTGTPPAALGSIKANIGHTKAAAGIAGLIKTALAIHHRTLPPTTGCHEPHPLLREPQVPLRVLAEPEPWPNPTPLAAVSAMGFGGINTHLVLTGPTTTPHTTLPTTTHRWAQPPPPHDIVLIEANNTNELTTQLNLLAEQANTLSQAELHDLACTQHHTTTGTATIRTALVADTPETLARAATAAAQRTQHWHHTLVVDHEAGFALSTRRQRAVGLLFPGQAAPVRARLDTWATRLTVPPLPANLDIRDGDTDTAIAQAAIVRQSLAGLAWLQALGCEPVAAVGHSLGEITALIWSGVLDPNAGLRLAVRRGQAMAEHGDPDSTMATLNTTTRHAVQLVSGTRAVIAGYNAPDQTVISGPTDAVHEVVTAARAAGIAASLLTVSHGFHSPAMSDAEAPLRRELSQIEFGPPQRSVVSTITGRTLSNSDDLRHLLIDQLTLPVRFTDALTELAHRCELLVEVGPGTILTALAARTTPDLPTVSLDCGGSTRQHALATATLAVAGAGDLEPWFAGRAYRPLRLDEPLNFLTNPCETSIAGQAAAAAASSALPQEDTGHTGDANVTGKRLPRKPTPENSSPLEILREHLARSLELPISGIRPDSRLLGDLHLNSLQVIQTIAAVAEHLGKQPPATPPSLAETTVEQAAESLLDLPSRDENAAESSADGVRPWVHAFEHRWVPAVGKSRPQPTNWKVWAPADHWLHSALTNASGDVREALAVLLTPQSGPAEITKLLRDLEQERPDHLLVLHHGHPGAAAMGRSAAVELSPHSVTVLQVPEDVRTLSLSHLPENDYLDLRVGPDGEVQRLATMPYEPRESSPVPLGPEDVCLVTGGVRGITAFSAAALAERTGCTLVLLGRTPADDPAVRAMLTDLRRRARAHYLSCDVSDREAVRTAVTRAAEHGNVRGLLHGAGINEPQRLAAVTADSLERTMAPKVEGLRSVLSVVGDQLRLVVGYGSVIGRRGLVGQAEYCLANDWMRVELEGWADEHPDCRVHLLEWSVWSDIGMGVRLDVLDSLREMGVEPIRPHDGVEVLLQILTDAQAPTTLLVTSRIPHSPTLAIEGPAQPLLRFAERTRTHTPGVEAVLETELSLGSDPYLTEHRIGGTAVLPAVLGLEAMAQATRLVDGETTGAWSFSGLALPSAVVVPEQGSTSLRVAALSAGRGEVDVVVREESDRFDSDRLSAKVVPAPVPPKQHREVSGPLADAPAPHPFYGPVFFHSGRFQRLLGYDLLSAFSVRAWIEARDETWFSDFHPRELLLGDPGAHDAAIHVLLACVPHRRALPVAAERMTVWKKPVGTLVVDAVERSHTADDYVFDIVVRQLDGSCVAAWQGLQLHAVGPNEHQSALPIQLVGPLLSRRLIEQGLGDHVELVVSEGEQHDDIDLWTQQVRTVSGNNDTPVATGRTTRSTSATRVGGHVLLAESSEPIGVHWEAGSAASTSEPPSKEDQRLFEAVATDVGERSGHALNRVLVARQALREIEDIAAAPLVRGEVTEDQMVVFHSGPIRVVTARLITDASLEPVTVAIAIHKGR